MTCPNPACRNPRVQPGDRFCGSCGQDLIRGPAQASVAGSPATLPPAGHASVNSGALFSGQADPRNGWPLQMTVEVDIETAIRGGTVLASVPLPDATGKHHDRTVELPIPRLTAEGSVLQFQPLGHTAVALQVLVRYRRHSLFRHGNHGLPPEDLTLVFPVSSVQGRDGGAASILTLDGAVPMTISASAARAGKLVLSGMGLPRTGSSLRGDLHVSLVVSDAAASQYARWGREALQLLADFGVSPAEQCQRQGWSPAQWRQAQPPSAFPSGPLNALFDTMFDPKSIHKMFEPKK